MEIMKRKDLSQLEIRQVSYGLYRVKYTTKRGDYYVAKINDVELIEKAKDFAFRTNADIKRLTDHVRMMGDHFRKNGEEIFRKH